MGAFSSVLPQFCFACSLLLSRMHSADGVTAAAIRDSLVKLPAATPRRPWSERVEFVRTGQILLLSEDLAIVDVVRTVVGAMPGGSGRYTVIMRRVGSEWILGK